MRSSVILTFVLALLSATLTAQVQELVIDAALGRVEVANDPSLMPSSGLTVEAWVYYDPSQPWGQVLPTALRMASTGQHAYVLRVKKANQKPQFGVRTDAGYVEFDASIAIPTKTWVHLAGTWDGSMLRLYVNGVPAGNQPLSGSLIEVTPALQIGSGDGSLGESWCGRLDEIRIWNHARSGTEILDAMFAQLDLDPGLVAAWHFNGDLEDETGGLDGLAIGQVSLQTATSPVEPLQLIVASRSTVGSPLQFTMRGALPNAPYFLDNSLSGTQFGTPLVPPLVGTFPLNAPLLNLSYGPLAPGIFVGYMGFLDSSGEASATFNVPPFTHLIGMELDSAFLYLTSLQPYTLGDISRVSTTTFMGAQPEISSIVPAIGPKSGGWAVTITGQNFTPTTTIAFGGVPASSLVVHGSSLITCLTPSSSVLGPVDVLLTDPVTDPASLPGGFTYVPNLFAVNLNPSYADPGDTVTILGNGFQAGTTVTVGGIPATILAQTASSLQITMPAGTSCHALVQVANPEGQTAALVINPGPVITGITPASGPSAGGQSVFITGQGFQPSAQVTIGGVPAAVTTLSFSLIEIVAPPGGPGAATLVVTNPDGCSVSASYQYN